MERSELNAPEGKFYGYDVGGEKRKQNANAIAALLIGHVRTVNVKLHKTID